MPRFNHPCVGAVAVLLALFACKTDVKKPGSETKGEVVENPRMAEPRTTEDSLKQGVISIVDAALTPLETRSTGMRARLEVRFDPARNSRAPVTIRPDSQAVVMRDDGKEGDSVASDGVFSGVVEISNAELALDATRTQEQNRGSRLLPPFSGRVRAAPLRLPAEAVQDLRRAVLRRRFPLDLFTFFNPNVIPRALMVNDPAVVQDPGRTFDVCTQTGTKMGKWTFGHLMTEMANESVTSISASDFALAWLSQWKTAQVVNTFTIPARAAIQATIIDPWLANSGGSGQLDLAQAPFRLLAIVNRVDLRQNLVYGSGSAGEGRFVFEAVDRRNGACNALPFTVIFEYGIPKKSCPAVRAWGKQWYALRNIAPTDPAYGNALQAITDQFVTAGSNPSQLPNRNALSQLRTNERAIGVPWELREFSLTGTGHLASTTTKQEPDMSFHNSDALVNWINANSAVVAAGKHKIPLTLSGAAFLAARAPIPGDNTGFFWGRGIDIPTANARFQLSVNTCSGCHTGETQTQFTHVKPGTGFPAALSGFLTGINVTDPDPSDSDNSVRTFNDLERRAGDLEGLVNSACIRQVRFNNISRMSH
jgi:hypothetical protein